MRKDRFEEGSEAMKIFFYFFLYETKSKGVRKLEGNEKKEEKSAPDFQGRLSYPFAGA